MPVVDYIHTVSLQDQERSPYCGKHTHTVFFHTQVFFVSKTENFKDNIIYLCMSKDTTPSRGK